MRVLEHHDPSVRVQELEYAPSKAGRTHQRDVTVNVAAVAVTLGVGYDNPSYLLKSNKFDKCQSRRLYRNLHDVFVVSLWLRGSTRPDDSLTDIHAFLAWFDITFECTHKKVAFSTGPHAKYTHWKYVEFSLIEPAKADDIHQGKRCSTLQRP